MDNASNPRELEKILQYRFKNRELLTRALVHRSFVYENPEFTQSDNETLEFLGDAVLGLTISHLLYLNFPDRNEGDLSRLRSAIVNERELTKIARRLQLGKYLLLGKGEELTGGRQKPSLLSDCLEALLAAIYLDSDFETVRKVVDRLFHEYLDAKQLADPLSILDKDYKTQLQELTQARFKQTPQYALEADEGPDHDKTFFMSVLLNDKVLARGVGKSKKEAQQDAAKKALEKLAGKE